MMSFRCVYEVTTEFWHHIPHNLHWSTWFNIKNMYILHWIFANLKFLQKVDSMRFTHFDEIYSIVDSTACYLWEEIWVLCRASRRWVGCSWVPEPARLRMRPGPRHLCPCPADRHPPGSMPEIYKIYTWLMSDRMKSCTKHEFPCSRYSWKTERSGRDCFIPSVQWGSLGIAEGLRDLAGVVASHLYNGDR